MSAPKPGGVAPEVILARIIALARAGTPATLQGLAADLGVATPAIGQRVSGLVQSGKVHRNEERQLVPGPSRKKRLVGYMVRVEGCREAQHETEMRLDCALLDVCRGAHAMVSNAPGICPPGCAAYQQAAPAPRGASVDHARSGRDTGGGW